MRPPADTELGGSPGDEPRYDAIGASYGRTRRTDPYIASHLWRALGEARSVVNVGAGTGSYEPPGMAVIAVEPSPTMADQRPSERPALIGAAEALPLADNCADAAMAVLTVHHWRDLETGIAEMKRVARDRVVVLTLEEEVINRSWTRHYAPALLEFNHELPPAARIAALIGDGVVETVPVTADCEDLYIESVYSRPELLLDPKVRANTSGFARMDDELERAAVEKLAADLESGEWDRRYGWLRDEPEHDVGLRLIRSGAE